MRSLRDNFEIANKIWKKSSVSKLRHKNLKLHLHGGQNTFLNPESLKVYNENEEYSSMRYTGWKIDRLCS